MRCCFAFVLNNKETATDIFMQNVCVWTGTAFYEKSVAAIPLQQTRGESSSFHKAPQMVKHSEDIVSYFHALVKWTVQQSDTCQIKRKCAFWYAPIGFLDVCLTWQFFSVGILRFYQKSAPLNVFAAKKSCHIFFCDTNRTVVMDQNCYNSVKKATSPLAVNISQTYHFYFYYRKNQRNNAI